MPDAQRKELLDGLAKSMRDLFSSDARDLMMSTIPTIPGGVTGVELAPLIAIVSGLSDNRREMIEELAPYVRQPLSAADMEALTKDMFSSEKTAALKALMRARAK